MRPRSKFKLGGPDHEDADVEKVISQMLWKNHRLFPPTSQFKNNWDAIMMIFVMYNCIVVPLELGFEFEKELAHRIIDTVIDMLFLCDIVLNFRTAYYNSDFEMVLDKKMIYRRYLRSWFPLDLFASFPFEFIIIEMLSVDASQLGVLSILKLPRLLRLKRIMKKLDKLKSANYIRALHTLSSFMLIAHWLACIWWLVGTFSYDRFEDSCDTATFTANCLAQEGVVFPDPFNPVCVTNVTTFGRICDDTLGRAWFTRMPGKKLFPGVKSRLIDRYMTALYWALTMLMKTPFESPDSLIEKIIGCVILFVSTLLFAVLLTMISTLYTQLSAVGTIKRDIMASLLRFTRSKNVPRKVEYKVLQYFDAQYQISDGLSDIEHYMMLPYALRLEVIFSIFGDTLLKSSQLMAKCSEECAAQILVLMRPMVCLENDSLIECGEKLDDLYMLFKGSLRITRGDTRQTSTESLDDEGESIRGGVSKEISKRSSPMASNARCSSTMSTARATLNSPFTICERPGTIFGGTSLFRGPRCMPYTATALKKCIIYSINNAELDCTLSLFDQDEREACIVHLACEHQILADAVVGGTKRKKISDAKAKDVDAISDAKAKDMDNVAVSAPLQRVSVSKPEQTPQQPGGIAMRMADIEKKMDWNAKRMDQITRNMASLAGCADLLLKSNQKWPLSRIEDA